MLRALRRDRGASAVEYGLIVVAIAAVIAAVVFTLGGRVRSTYDTTCENWNTAAGTGTC